MINHQKIKQQLRNGNPLNGCWISMYDTVASEIVARCGYDVIMVDLEHSPGSYRSAISVFQAIGGNRCSPMLRVNSSNIAEIKKALDIGPEGIMVPNIRNVVEAESIVAACRYGPDGVRGAAPGILRATGWGDYLPDYYEYMASEFLLIAQIESVEALNQVEDIAAVDGIDMLFIGPNDLSASLGNLGDFSSKAFGDAISRIEKAALDAGKFVGAIPFPGFTARQLYQAGHQLVISGTDTLLLKKAAEDDLEMLRQAAQQQH